MWKQSRDLFVALERPLCGVHYNKQIQIAVRFGLAVGIRSKENNLLGVTFCDDAFGDLS